MVRKYIPVHLRGINATPETKSRLIALAEGDPANTEEENAILEQLVRTVLSGYRKAKAPVTPLLPYLLENIGSYLIQIRRIEAQLVPQKCPKSAPPPPQKDPEGWLFLHNFAPLPEITVSKSGPAKRRFAAELRQLRTQLRLALTQLDNTLQSIHTARPASPGHQPKARAKSSGPTPSVLIPSNNDDFDHKLFRNAYIRWRMSGKRGNSYFPPPAHFTPEELAEMDALYGPAPAPPA